MADAAQSFGQPALPNHPLPVNSALIVEPVLSDAVAIAATLTARHFQVTVAETFAQAKERLNTRVPELLVADIRLGEYNGLHLVLRAKALRPETAAIVTSSQPDPVLQADAEAMGATFVVKPVRDAELAAAIFRTIFRSANPTSSGPLRPQFERRVSERRAEIIQMPGDRRRADRRRDLEGLLRAVARQTSAPRRAGREPA